MPQTRSTAVIAFAVASLMGNVSQAADETGGFAIDGPGGMPCEIYMSLDANHPGLRDLAGWMAGYYTAMNRTVDDTFDLTPWQSQSTLLGLMRQFCEQAPAANVAEGTHAIMNYLAPLRLTTFDEIVSQGPEGSTVTLYASTIAAASAKLTELGISVGTTDLGLAQAIQNFQHQEGLEVTGVLDQRTLGRLFQ